MYCGVDYHNHGCIFLSAYHQSGTMLSDLDILTLSSLQPFEVSPHFAHMETEAERDFDAMSKSLNPEVMSPQSKLLSVSFIAAVSDLGWLRGLLDLWCTGSWETHLCSSVALSNL